MGCTVILSLVYVPIGLFSVFLTVEILFLSPDFVIGSLLDLRRLLYGLFVDFVERSSTQYDFLLSFFVGTCIVLILCYSISH